MSFPLVLLKMQIHYKKAALKGVRRKDISAAYLPSAFRVVTRTPNLPQNQIANYTHPPSSPQTNSLIVPFISKW